MIAKHTFRIQAKCPVNGDVDTYECEVSVTELIQCEKLLADAAEYAQQTLFQEQLTAELSRRWNATVKTVGTHVGGRVATECIAFPKSLVAVNTTGEHA
jgi:hypothetical protein